MLPTILTLLPSAVPVAGCDAFRQPVVVRHADFSVIESWYRQFGIEHLPALHVSYTAPSGKVSLGTGGGLNVSRNTTSDAWLRTAPRLESEGAAGIHPHGLRDLT